MPDRHEVWKTLTASSTQVLICDLQEEIVARSHTTKPDALKSSAAVLCEIAQLFGLPITLSAVPEEEKAPKLISELKPFATESNVFTRASASPFVDEKTPAHLASLHRPTLLLAGFATEVVVLHAAVNALDAGYGVIVITDACGGQSQRTEDAALQHIHDAGGILSSVVTVATALSPDFSSEQGQKMFGIVQKLRLA
jgi:nicotinamidase-related amidase